MSETAGNTFNPEDIELSEDEIAQVELTARTELLDEVDFTENSIF